MTETTKLLIMCVVGGGLWWMSYIPKDKKGDKKKLTLEEEKVHHTRRILKWNIYYLAVALIYFWYVLLNYETFSKVLYIILIPTAVMAILDSLMIMYKTRLLSWIFFTGYILFFMINIGLLKASGNASLIFILFYSGIVGLFQCESSLKKIYSEEGEKSQTELKKSRS